MAWGYGVGGTVAAVGVIYTIYCHIGFYKDVSKAIVKKLATNGSREKTLEEIFTSEGIRKNSELQPNSRYIKHGGLGTLLLKPTIHLAKRRLQKGYYDRLAAEYARNH
ncbi:hypothetical protein KY345_00820 [Candidatus Woesearchaeota archaeon]|nr:hypothetical protein [Candidatus Woesearchaeota archaeon]